MITNFILGFFGSLHCIAMCGPIMLSVMNKQQRVNHILVYHTGRISGYMIIGLILGTLGVFIHLLELQKIAIILAGILILVLNLAPSLGSKLMKRLSLNSLYSKFNQLLSSTQSSRYRWFISGTANGLLPCGLTYIAAANALTSATPLQGSLQMISFGLGTIPALLLINFSGQLFYNQYKSLINKPLYWISIISGIIMLYRGIAVTYPDFDVLMLENTLQAMPMCGR